MLFEVKTQDEIILAEFELAYVFNDEPPFQGTVLKSNYNQDEIKKYIATIGDLNISNLLTFKFLHFEEKYRRKMIKDKNISALTKNINIMTMQLECFSDFDLIVSAYSQELC